MSKNITVSLAAALLAFSMLPVFVAKAGADPIASSSATSTAKTIYLRITAYSSSPDETDYNPFFTADGEHVRDGIVANNSLPFGTKIMIPALFGLKVFTVEDRMAKRFSHTIDIWMTSKAKALFFGVNYAHVIVLGTSSPAIAEK